MASGLPDIFTPLVPRPRIIDETEFFLLPDSTSKNKYGNFFTSNNNIPGFYMIKLKSKASAPIRKKFQAVSQLRVKTKYEHWVDFDSMGENEVRTKIEGGKFGGNRMAAAAEWLGAREKKKKLEKKRDAEVQKAIKAARIAMVAAWITAIAALVIGVSALYFYFS